MEAKGKIKRRHREAINGYQEWLKSHPKAKRRERIRAFDMYVDSAILQEELQKQNAA